MNTSVLHAMAMESAENVLCGTKAEQQNRRRQDREVFIGKAVGARLSSGMPVIIQRKNTKLKFRNLEETIEVLSAVGESENRRNSEKYSRRNGRENRKCNLWNLYRHRHHDSGSTCLVNLETEADCQTAVSVNHQRAYGCRCAFENFCI